MNDRSSTTRQIHDQIAEQHPDGPPLAIYPVDDFPDGEQQLTSEADSTTTDLWGHCAGFCAHNGIPTSGASVLEHGPWCGSVSIAWATGLDAAGRKFSFYADLAELYTHGTYLLAELQTRPEVWRSTLIRVSIGGDVVTPDEEDGETAAVFMTTGQVRRFAAGLLHAADAADGLLRDPTTAKAGRQRHEGI